MSGRPLWTDYMDREVALDHLRTPPPGLAGGSLRAYVGAVLDRLTEGGCWWVARELGVRNPARIRQRLERQIVARLERQIVARLERQIVARLEENALCAT